MAPTRWQSENTEDQSRQYVRRFDRLEASGVDLHGEARMVDAVVAPGSSILDAGCGTARLGAELARRGHTVTAVDLDPVFVEAARAHTAITVHQADLTALELGETFDCVVAAGNVMVFMTPGTERAALERIAAHMNPTAVFVAGFATDRQYTVEQFDDDLAAAGLRVEQRFATWDLRTWHDGADWAVTVARPSGLLA
ncbi:class I SAM-dependent DNA methyltransferase [Rhodococcoides kyotonense]|uniref:Methyltransferase domain-containing protein n=1 Tax=Rhodococcoides kyotonense TaxID=398843 RepID=A0A239HTT0_9NOCA|nr:class I SAM-dependent methyltransferase [Rhodococcus kyotonensis]SNS84699.1 Methyltransferase domain-containing protein [Rhodococcus kyotonensis]